MVILGIKEKTIQIMSETAYQPLLADDLVLMLELSKNEKKEILKVLNDMITEGYVIKTKKKRYALSEKMGLVVGRLQGNSRGFGFIIPDKNEIEDVFIPADFMNGAMHNDRVIARINSVNTQTSKSEGEIIRILERANEEIVGTFERQRNFGFVMPDDARINMDIYISKKDSLKIKDGYKVVCKITRWPEGRRNPEGVISEIIGHVDDGKTSILSIIRKFNLKVDFPAQVEEEIKEISEKIEEKEILRRRDLREVKMVTIDGADAKDLDDAISIEKMKNGDYKLGVHIADVTHYVKKGTELDKEALDRGTSVYLVDRVIPMLPSKLSNGVCSLNSNIDRLTLSVIMIINEKGEVKSHEIVESVINIDKRMIYEDVSNILENNDEGLEEKYKDLVSDFKLMEKLSLVLRKRRENRGAIDFDFPESKVILDNEGKPIEVKKYERRIANRIIEEFMLLCNETVAEQFCWMDAPFVYRIHEEPSMEKIEEFNKFISNLGYTLKGISNGIHPKVLQNLLKKISGKKEEAVINMLMLRSLKKAKYAVKSTGHFGLATNYYTHFTSPIRRYPDLAIHRIIKAYINNEATPKWIDKMSNKVMNVAEQSSTKEREAVEAERETTDLKKAEYMQSKLGETFEGIISGITSFGIFVELENTIEGLIRLSSLIDDYYIYNHEKRILVGENSRKTYKMGDAMQIVVSKVDVLQKEINFVLF
ncbi:MAG: ribonuclease R [Clostridiales bacterium]|nr:ribonuclease R [Clostridiales bacterium]